MTTLSVLSGTMQEMYYKTRDARLVQRFHLDLGFLRFRGEVIKAEDEMCLIPLMQS